MTTELFYIVDGNSYELEQVETVKQEYNAVLDERKNYVYSKVRLAFHGVFNPAATSFVINDRTIVSTDDQFPATTTKALRHILLQPRGIFRLVVDGNEVLRVPKVGEKVDVAGGPTPISCDVSEQHGVRTWRVLWTVELSIHESDLFVKPRHVPIMLSHSWEQTETLSRALGYRSIRVTHGRAVFSQAKMPNKTYPDSYRVHFLPPLIRGFAREEINVTAESSGNAATYTVTDTEQYLEMKVGHITFAECTHSVDTTSPSILNVIGASLGLASNLMAAKLGAENAIAKGKYGPSQQRLDMMQRTTDIGQTINGVTPKIFYNVLARVKGDRQASIEYLLQTGKKICDHRMRTLGNGYAWNYHAMVNLDENSVEVGLSARGDNFTQTFAAVINNMIAIGDDLAPDVAVKANPTPELKPPAVRRDVGSMVPPTHKGSRGYALAEVVAQQLSGNNQKPAAPEIIKHEKDPAQDPHRKTF